RSSRRPRHWRDRVASGRIYCHELSRGFGLHRNHVYAHLQAERAARFEPRASRMMREGKTADRLLGPGPIGLLCFLAMLLLPLVANPYILFVGTQLSIFVILAVGLNILVGYCGQLAFSQAAIFGIGAYGAGLLKVHLGWSFLLAVPAGAALACAVGTLIAL